MRSVVAEKRMAAAVVSLGAQVTKTLGFGFARKLQQDRVLLLQGDLGSGKTCFAQGLAQGLGVKINVPSPTYTLVNEYPLPQGGVLYHLDCYRTGQTDTLLAESVTELLADPKNLLVVEWGERLPTVLLTDPFWQIAFTYLGENSRRLCYTRMAASSV